MVHPDEGTIHAWLDGALDAAAAADLESHVESCAHCRSVVAEARGFIAASARIVRALDDVPGDVLPRTTGSDAVPSARTATDRLPLGRRRWAQPLAAAAALAVMISGGVFMAERASTPMVGSDAATLSREIAVTAVREQAVADSLRATGGIAPGEAARSAAAGMEPLDAAASVAAAAPRADGAVPAGADTRQGGAQVRQRGTDLRESGTGTRQGSTGAAVAPERNQLAAQADVASVSVPLPTAPPGPPPTAAGAARVAGGIASMSKGADAAAARAETQSTAPSPVPGAPSAAQYVGCYEVVQDQANRNSGISTSLPRLLRLTDSLAAVPNRMERYVALSMDAPVVSPPLYRWFAPTMGTVQLYVAEGRNITTVALHTDSADGFPTLRRTECRK